MNTRPPISIQFWKQVRFFVIHLRWHYQVFILSGCYLLGGLYYTGNPDWQMFIIQFLNVHLLLFGGATAYNSYWDKDKGRIGGLRKPPPMTGWMHTASLILQFAGLVLALPAGYLYSLVYLVSILMFWLYSTPLAKWKGHPWLSMVAIAVSTGVCSFLMGYMALGGILHFALMAPALGCSFILLSLYPVSQIFQMDEDRQRGYQTFAIRYGLNGVKTFFILSFLAGIGVIGFTLHLIDPLPANIFILLSSISGIMIFRQLKKIKGTEEDYERVMHMKYLTSGAFVAYILFWLLWGV